MTVTRAVVLARGLGTRMRAADPDVHLTDDQHRAADAGLKHMIPVHGRPFLDFILSGLADAGLTRVALVVAPDHDALRQYYTGERSPARVQLSFVVQQQALGTADAVIAAEPWIGQDDFLVMNADNLYPTDALRSLAAIDEPGMLAFDRDDLIRSSNIPADRIKAFAYVDVDADGYLVGIVEKPSEHARPPDHVAASEPVASAFRRKHQLFISMNCWRFDRRIFQACRDVPRSSRGEFELPEAVGLAIARGLRLRALPAHGPVLDLSRRADAKSVADRLATLVPQP